MDKKIEDMATEELVIELEIQYEAMSEEVFDFAVGFRGAPNYGRDQYIARLQAERARRIARTLELLTGYEAAINE